MLVSLSQSLLELIVISFPYPSLQPRLAAALGRRKTANFAVRANRLHIICMEIVLHRRHRRSVW